MDLFGENTGKCLNKKQGKRIFKAAEMIYFKIISPSKKYYHKEIAI